MKIISSRFSMASQVLFAGAMLAGISGCGQNAQNAPPSTPGAPGPAANAGGGKKKQIAAILMQDDQFFRLTEIGMKEAAKKHDVELLTGSANGALDKEISLVDTYTARGVDAILVAPLNPSGSAPALKRAAAKGIKIIIYNGEVNDKIGVAAVSSNQVELGSSTGKVVNEYVQKKLGGKGKIALIEYVSLLPSQGTQRPKGFKDEIKKTPGLKIVAEQDAWLAPQAEKVVTDILNAHPDINVIWAANEGGTVGAVTAVKNAGKAGKVVVFGTDMSDQIADFLLSKENILQAVTGQKPLEMGNAAVDTALSAIDGKSMEQTKIISGTVFKRSDVAAINAFKAKAAKATQ